MNRTSVICSVAGALALGAVVASTTAGTASATGAARSHTLTITTHELASTQAGRHHQLLVESDRAVHAGHTIGYTANTCAFDFAAHRALCYVTLARAKGQLRVRATVDADTGAITGRVVGGSGAYRGADGTVSGRPGSGTNTSRITLTWKS
jgi:hypothetical protein